MAIITPNISNLCNFNIGSDVGSDHIPIHVTITTKVDRNNPKTFRPFKDVDWKIFKNTILDQFNSSEPITPQNTQDIDSIINNVTKLINKTLDTIAPKKFIKNKKWWTFTDQIKIKIKKRRAIRRLQKNNPTKENNNLYNRINKEVQALIKQQKQLDWKRMSEKLNNKNQYEAWKVIKNVQSNKSTGTANVLKNKNGETAQTDLDKAEMMANHLANKQTLPTDQKFNHDSKIKINSYIDENPKLFKPLITNIATTHALNVEITLKELNFNLKTSKTNSATGPDELNYLTLKNLPDEIKTYICDTFNTCLKWGYFPNQWKIATVIMIPKPNKDKNNVENYRPISLLSCFGKTFEKIITKRLTNFLLNNNSISKFQCGFLPGRSTEQHLFRLSQDAHTALKLNQHTGCVLLDVEGAFDCVWTNGLKYKLLDYNLPDNIIRLLSNFLSNRKFSVKLNHSLTNQTTPEAGTPQGSVLSPLLFILYINDIPLPHSNSIKMSQYADDIAIWLSTKNSKHAQTTLQNYLNDISKWCNDWFIKINASKTQFVIFHRYKHKKPQIKLHFENIPITQTDNAKFLGITFDEKLTWETHINNIRATIFRKCNILRSLSGRTWGAQKEYLINIYRAWAIPNITYGCIAFLSLAEKHIQTCQIIQNSIIRCAYKLPKHTRINTLHDIASLNKIKETILEIATKQFIRIKVTDIVQDTIAKYTTIDHKITHKSPLDILL
jgi:hypothetical protein